MGIDFHIIVWRLYFWGVQPQVINVKNEGKI